MNILKAFVITIASLLIFAELLINTQFNRTFTFLFFATLSLFILYISYFLIKWIISITIKDIKEFFKALLVIILTLGGLAIGIIGIILLIWLIYSIGVALSGISLSTLFIFYLIFCAK